MKYLAFSDKLDRIALGMTLSARGASIVCEIVPSVWLIHSKKGYAQQAFTYLFGLPEWKPKADSLSNGACVILVAVTDVYGFAREDFWDRTGL